MDPRRLLTWASAGLALCGCATLHGTSRSPAAPAVMASAPTAAASPPVATAPPQPIAATMAPIPNPGPAAPVLRTQVNAPLRRPPTASQVGRVRRGTTGRRITSADGRTAIAAANAQARQSSRSDGFVGGVQVFAYDPGRVYEVWTAPLRVTTLTLAPGETLVSKAAGDTVRWQIGETTSGQGPGQRAHVMIKPLQRGLETNLVLATNQRVYLLQLKSGAPEAFNAAVTWDLGAVLAPATAAGEAPPPAPDALVTPAGPLDARFRIEAHGRRPAWAPTAVMTDGVRTFLSFPSDLAAGEAPALFVVGPGGETQLVNYRQQAGLWVVDRVFEEAELRIGDKRPQIVRIVRTAGDGS